MTIARAHLFDPAVSRWYHWTTRCVRRAFLLGEGTNDRTVSAAVPITGRRGRRDCARGDC